jgi:hypothetical protein
MYRLIGRYWEMFHPRYIYRTHRKLVKSPYLFVIALYAAAVVFLEAERSRRNYYLVETTHGSSGE